MSEPEIVEVEYTVPAVMLDFHEVVDKVNKHYGHPSTMYAHIMNGTVNEYFSVVLDDVVYDLTIMPIARQLNDQETDDDQETVTAGFRQITETLGFLFNKDGTAIFKEMVRRMNDYPIDDVREAYQLRRKNALH